MGDVLVEVKMICTKCGLWAWGMIPSGWGTVKDGDEVNLDHLDCEIFARQLTKELRDGLIVDDE